MIKFKNLSKLLTAIIVWIDIMKNKTNLKYLILKKY